MDELECLNYEFNFTDASAPEFHVSLQIFGFVLLDPALDCRDFIEQVRRGTARINKRLMLTKELVGQLPAAGDPARLDQGDPFPRFAKACVVILHALE